ncbi:MAG: metallopeptidase [Nanoarchaeota archaeon]|nr:metallopeptidase [Nanoarchaeota archaeon]MBU4086944.1 metallopeptidase [Nanoarchaeota archaeon]
MGIKYQEAGDIREEAERIVGKLGWNHVQLENVGFLRSNGSSSRRTIARCHALSVPLQLGLNRKAFYTIEVISERFDKLSEEERIKVIIHELMHIPKSFGGGFIHHDKVCERSINQLFQRYIYG